MARFFKKVQPKLKQTLADEKSMDYSFLSLSITILKKKYHFKSRYQNLHSISMFIGTPSCNKAKFNRKLNNVNKIYLTSFFELTNFKPS